MDALCGSYSGEEGKSRLIALVMAPIKLRGPKYTAPIWKTGEGYSATDSPAQGTFSMLDNNSARGGNSTPSPGQGGVFQGLPQIKINQPNPPRHVTEGEQL